MKNIPFLCCYIISPEFSPGSQGFSAVAAPRERVFAIFKSKVVDVSTRSYTVEVTGNASKIRAIIDIFRPLSASRKSYEPVSLQCPGRKKTREGDCYVITSNSRG